jgi:hypothetical protein
MSFSSTSTAWPFLLGVEEGTWPFGRALRIKLSPKEATDRFLLSFTSSSLLPSKREANAANTTKKKSSTVLIRAITQREREREREREILGFIVGKKCKAKIYGERFLGVRRG